MTGADLLVVLVTGGRAYRDRDRVFAELDRLNPCCVIHGDARGADALAKAWVLERKRSHIPMPADWRQGPSAGPRRNAGMVVQLLGFRKQGVQILVLAFPGGRGTADCIDKARKAGVEVLEISA